MASKALRSQVIFQYDNLKMPFILLGTFVGSCKTVQFLENVLVDVETYTDGRLNLSSRNKSAQYFSYIIVLVSFNNSSEVGKSMIMSVVFSNCRYLQHSGKFTKHGRMYSEMIFEHSQVLSSLQLFLLHH